MRELIFIQEMWEEKKFVNNPPENELWTIGVESLLVDYGTYVYTRHKATHILKRTTSSVELVKGDRFVLDDKIYIVKELIKKLDGDVVVKVSEKKIVKLLPENFLMENAITSEKSKKKRRG